MITPEGKEFVNKLWESHIDVFNHFDLVCYNGHDLSEETRQVSLFSTLTTVEHLILSAKNPSPYIQMKLYLQGSKYYSDRNKDSDY